MKHKNINPLKTKDSIFRVVFASRRLFKPKNNPIKDATPANIKGTPMAKAGNTIQFEIISKRMLPTISVKAIIVSL